MQESSSRLRRSNPRHKKTLNLAIQGFRYLVPETESNRRHGDFQNLCEASRIGQVLDFSRSIRHTRPHSRARNRPDAAKPRRPLRRRTGAWTAAYDNDGPCTSTHRAHRVTVEQENKGGSRRDDSGDLWRWIVIKR